MSNIKVRVGQQNTTKVISSLSGAAGGRSVEAKNVIGGIASVTQLHVSGLSTFIGIGTFHNDLYVGGDLYVKDDIFFDELTARNINVTGIGTINVLRATTLNVSGLSTFVGVGTFNDDLYVGGDLYVKDDIFFDELTARNINVTGIGTINVLRATTLNVSGLSTFAGITTVTGETLFTKQLSVSGVSTFAGITTVTGPTLFSKQLNVSGVSTFTGLVDANGGAEIDNIRIGVANDNTIDTSTGGLTLDSNSGLTLINDQLIVIGVSTFINNVNVSQALNVGGDVVVSGLSTFVGIITNQSTIFGTQLSISGLSTFVGVGTFSNDLYVGGDLYVKDDIFLDELTAKNAYITGFTTTTNLRVLNSLFYTPTYTSGIAYFNSSGLMVSTGTTNVAINYTNCLLTTDDTGIPTWSTTIDGGTY